MATMLTIPPGNENGVVQTWLRKDGEFVKAGEPVLVVETDKVAVEVEAPVDGTLAILVPEGTRVAVGEPLGRIGAGEQASAAASAQKSNGAATVAVLREDGVPIASPLARRMAHDLGLNLLHIRGSGPGGRIIKDDVVQAAARKPEPAQPAPQPAPAQQPAPQPQVAPQPAPAIAAAPMSGMRKAIAEQMERSARTTAHVTLVATVDMTDAYALYERLRPAIQKHYNSKLTLTHLFLKAVARALELHPKLNGHLSGDGLHLSKEVHLGVAVALEDGLVVPVLRHANTLSLGAIAAQSNRLAEQARAGTIPREAASGATFTVTNLGAYGIDAFTPIINVPEIAILGIGSASEQPAVRDGQLCIRRLATLSLAFDHRATDGATAAKLLSEIRAILEDPDLLVV